ncbi:MAG TPA: amidohydrolase family protein [Acidobacteriaceae bacterium]|nr:amidohydrolase family protein [Acidobacteriaceae bacterium]
MRRFMLFFCCILLVFRVTAGAQAAAPKPLASFAQEELKDFTALDPIDVHTHVYQTDPVFLAMLRKLHVHLLDVVVADLNDNASHRTFEPLKKAAWQFVAASQGHASLSTTVDPFTWDDPGFPRSAIQSINQDFTRGAVAATIWANTGMSMKDASGTPALPDDRKLEPFYKDLVSHHKTLMAHIGVADEAWVPNRARPPAVPAVLQARDQIVERNPALRVVGAHFGSLKENIGDLAARLRKYPNLAVDTSSRMDYLMAQPSDQVRAFFLEFQNRILYGTDSAFRQKDIASASIPKFENRYAVDWRYLAGHGTFQYDGREVQSLNLPQPVLRKLYHGNAVRWIPGIGQ